MRKSTPFLVTATLLVLGCSAEGSALDGESNIDSSAQAQCTAKALSQNDGTECNACNCGMTSAAMMRYVMCCSATGDSGSCDYGGGKMRDYYQEEFGYGAHYCGSGNVGKNGKVNQCGGDIDRLAMLMEHIHEHDQGPNFAAKTEYDSSVSLTKFKSRLDKSGGWVAVVHGGDTLGAGLSPCGFDGRHSIFVYEYDEVHDRFRVYDPFATFNGAKSYDPDRCSVAQALWWSADALDKWSNHTSSVVNALMGKGEQPCALESDEQFCIRLGKSCDKVSGTDNCGNERVVASCGSCTSPEACGGGGTANVCGGNGCNENGVCDVVYGEAPATCPSDCASNNGYTCTYTFNTGNNGFAAAGCSGYTYDTTGTSLRAAELGGGGNYNCDPVNTHALELGFYKYSSAFGSSVHVTGQVSSNQANAGNGAEHAGLYYDGQGVVQTGHGWHDFDFWANTIPGGGAYIQAGCPDSWSADLALECYVDNITVSPVNFDPYADFCTAL